MQSTQNEDKITGKAYDQRLMRRLWPFIQPYRWRIAIAVVTLFGSALLQMAGPYLIKLSIDDYIAPGNMSGLIWIAGLYLLVLVSRFILAFIEQFLTQWIGQHVTYDLRTAVFNHIQKLSLRFFDKNPVGRLITRVTSDVDALNELVTAGLVSVFGNIFTIIGIMTAMVWLNWRLSLATFAVLPIFFYAAFLFKSRVRESFRQVRTRISRLNSFLQENITGMRIVQLFNREQRNFAHFDQINYDHLDANLQTIFYFAIFFPVVRLLSTLAIALILWYGGVLLLDGAATFGIIVAFIQYADQVYHPIQDLSEKYNILQNAMASSERIFTLLDEDITVKNPSQPKPMNDFRHQIEFRHVWFAYDDENYVLKNVSFTVNKGESVALVGATGSGKTSLINLLCRFYDVNQGQILIDGTDIREIDMTDLRQLMGLVLQDVFLFSGTIDANIRLGNPVFSQAQVEEAAKRTRAHDFILRLPLGYQTEVKERGSALSVGQKQLLSFARALVYDPQILVLDEATSNIDTETELLIQNALNVLLTDRTSIIIAHRLSTIKHVDKIIVLHKGELREMGSHDELLTKRDIYFKLYQLQYKEQVYG